MDIGKLLLAELSSARRASDGLGGSLFVNESPGISAVEIDGLSDEKKKQIAKDFESVLISKLFDQVKDTIGGWDSEEDGPSKQMQGLFWQYLALDIADKGGFGLWKDIYKFLTDAEHPNMTAESLDRNI